MSKNASALKVKLSSYDELFGAKAPAASDQIVNVTSQCLGISDDTRRATHV